jgi:beta-N-acetylglucosaminidase/uncharacterized protein YgiM (DUF1202 family)
LFKKHKFIIFMTSFLLLFTFVSPFTPSLSNVEAASTEQQKIDKVISYAKSWLNKNVKYKMGGTNLVAGGEVDCSYFIQQVFKQVGINLPRTTWEQVSLGTKVNLDSLKPGDLVFFNTYADPYWNSKGNYSSHVGIYLGNNQFINAQNTGGILIQTLVGNGYWDKKFTVAKRIINADHSTPNYPQTQPVIKIGLITNTSGLNVRSGPSTSFPRIGGVYKNDKVEIVEVIGDWYKIKFNNGFGYINNLGVQITSSNTTPTKGFREEIKETKTLYTAPCGTGNATSNAIAPQTVTVTEKWYKINTWIGPKWIGFNADSLSKLKLSGNKLTFSTGNANLYETPCGPYTGSAISPQEVTVLEYWYKIETWIGPMWIHFDMKGVTTPPAQPSIKIGLITNTSGLNVRSGPGTSFPRIGGVYKNDRVEIVEQIGDWYKIKFGNGFGYINNLGVEIQTGNGTQNPNLENVTYNYVSISYQKALDIQMRNRPQIWKSGKWVGASRSETDYYMNPRNFINHPTQKYQFLDISLSGGVSEAEIANFLKDKGVLAGKASIFMKAAKDFNISPVYLVAHASLETNNGKSDLAKGYISKLGWTKGKKIYNVYGYGANDGPVRNGIDYAVENGAKYAYQAGWFTLDQAIYDGARTIAKYHFNGKYKQTTLYENRWNPVAPGVNQYATDVRWAYNQAADLKKMFDKFPNAKLVFKVPVYK